MQELKDKFIYIALIILIVSVILFSNLGQTFKNDISSPVDILNHVDFFKNTWINSRVHSAYLDSTSNYITGILKGYNIKPLDGEDYLEEWENTAPNIVYPSTLEVISTSPWGKIVKSYNYEDDFREDFRGLVKPGTGIASIYIGNNIKTVNESKGKILLFDGYRNKSNEEIAAIDKELLAQGVKYVISPSPSGDLKKDSGLFDGTHIISDTGLTKLLVTTDTFVNLSKYDKYGYKIKLKSGSKIETAKYKNIYGIIEGKNKNYKPLVIFTFYDGLYSNSGYSDSDFDSYTQSASLLLNTIRSIKLQRAKAPDRSIIFVFASGYLNNKEGLNKMYNKNIDGDILILDGFGGANENFLSYSSDATLLSESLEYYLNKYNFKVVSKNVFDKSKFTFLHLIAAQRESGSFDITRINQSGKFILSFIGEECYNLDFLSGNIRIFRMLKRFVKDYSAFLSLITIVFLTYVVFKDSGKKYH